MWIALTILLFTLVAHHFWWRARLARERAVWQTESSRRESLGQSAEAEARARQDALLDSMIEGVLVLDEAERVQFANPAFAEMFATTGVLRGKTLIEAVRLSEMAGIVERARREGRVVDQELRLSGDPERWLQISAVGLMGADNQRLGTILVFHDLTRIKKLERVRQEFVANVSHELRTPLSHIKGYTETLLGGAKDDPETAVRFLQTIERNSERLKLLIEDLLTISELESGRVTMNIQCVRLRPLVDKVFDDFRSRATARSVTLLNESPELTVRADMGRLEQVITNLVDNAIKYGGSGGQVTVAAQMVDEMVELCVQDHGPGLPQEALERVFERFYRVDKARSRDQGGTGLGLSIVKHIIQNHGGRVRAESEPGKGSKFFLTLPRAPDNDSADAV